MRAFLLVVLGVCAAALGAPGEADLKVIKQRMIESLAADARSADAALEYLRTLRADGSWGDVDYSDKSPAVWKPMSHTSRLVMLAKAHRAGALDDAAKEKILRAYDYWVKLDPQCPNWWYNQIGCPTNMGDFLILMETELSAEQLAAGVRILKRAAWEKWTGQNLVWGTSIQIVRGCVENSVKVVAEAYERMYREIRVAGPGEEGIQADFSFHQHGALLYSGGYGAAFTVDCARFVARAAGTAFAVPAEKMRLLERYVLDHQQWGTVGGIFDYSVTGREITRAGKSAAGLIGATRLLARVEGPRRNEFEELGRRLRSDPDVRPLEGNRHFWKSDYMVHRRAGYVSTVRMFSNRLLNTDGYINGENRKSHHLADGAMLVYVAGNEYADLFPVWDWLRIPGTTIEQNTPLEPRRVCYRGTTAFVGGVSDGKNGVAAMHLKSGKLEARKAWFCFDGQIVCLGAGIACPTDNPVYTSIEQCRLRGPVRVNGAVEQGTRELADARWVHHASVGYVFPKGAKAHVGTQTQTQTGAWSDIGVGSSKQIEQGVFSLWLDHGRQPAGATYEYVVLPGVSAEKMDRQAAEPAVEVLSNTPAMQAVRHTRTGLVGAVFVQGGKVAGLAVDRPCLVMMKPAEKTVELTAANPENQPIVVNVEVDAELAGEGVERLGAGRSRVRIELPGGLQAGRSVTRVFER